MTAQQDWVCKLSYMQQSVLFAAIRAPDGVPKNHIVKILMRWYRRCVLVSAFDGKVLDDPFSLGGGSFTGPFTDVHVRLMGYTNHPKPIDVFDKIREVYLQYVDELPHHFQLHFMHAAQILGYKHPDKFTRNWWKHFYLMIVNDAHLFPESEALMDERLSDNAKTWRLREVVTAKWGV